MRAMNDLVNVRELNEAMGAMAREMERAGLIAEIVGEAMASDCLYFCIQPYTPSFM